MARGPRGDRVPAVDVYLFPCAVGRGFGDIDEVLTVGRRLSVHGYSIRIYRSPGRPWPSGLEGPWEWPPVTRARHLRPHHSRAITITSSWGVTCAPARAEPYGRAGPWAEEVAEVEAVYGPAETLHVSLEEFGRSLTSAAATKDRYREAGRSRILGRARGSPSPEDREVSQFHDLYRKHRAFGQRNVVHLYPGLLRSPSFEKEFPEAVPTGPVWPTLQVKPGRNPWRADRPQRWLWYASPGSSVRLLPLLAAGMRGAPFPIHLDIRGDLPVDSPQNDGLAIRHVPSLSPGAWHALFTDADLRIVTGSRTLLEALVLGRPFLYFNGVTGGLAADRPHRIEKLRSLLEWLRRQGVSRAVRHDLSDFARLRRIPAILHRAATDRAWRGAFRAGRLIREEGVGLPPGDDVVVELAREFGSGRYSSPELVRQTRASRVGDLRRIRPVSSTRHSNI
jgi:hypothetical protein